MSITLVEVDGKSVWGGSDGNQERASVNWRKGHHLVKKRQRTRLNCVHVPVLCGKENL